MPIKIFCNNCDKATNHSLLASVDEHGEQGVVHWKDMYQILKCGCGNVTVRKQQWCSEWQEPGSEPHYNYTFLPPRHFRKKPKWFSQLDQKLIDVLDEVYAALQHGLYYVATVCIRTVLDMVMVDKVKDVGNNQDKYTALLAKGIVTENQLDLLKAAIETGDAAAHRGYRPSADDLRHLIVITETIIEKLYIDKKKEEYLLGKAFEVKSNVPPRKSHKI